MALMAAAIISMVAGVGKGIAEVSAADAEAAELKKQAEIEGMAAKQRQLQRTSELNKVLAQNIVSGSTAGIGFEGSPRAIAEATSRDISLGEGAESLSDRLRQESAKRGAGNIRRAGRIQAAGSILGGATTALASGAFGK